MSTVSPCCCRMPLSPPAKTLWWNKHTHRRRWVSRCYCSSSGEKPEKTDFECVSVSVCLQCSQVACSNHMVHCRSTAQPSGRKKKMRWSLFLLFLRKTFSGCFCYFMLWVKLLRHLKKHLTFYPNLPRYQCQHAPGRRQSTIQPSNKRKGTLKSS